MSDRIVKSYKGTLVGFFGDAEQIRDTMSGQHSRERYGGRRAVILQRVPCDPRCLGYALVISPAMDPSHEGIAEEPNETWRVLSADVVPR